MAIDNKKYLDMVGLSVYDGLIKQKIASDILEEAGVTDTKIAKLGESGFVEEYATADGMAVSGVTYYKMFGAGTDEDPHRYEALPYTDASTGITWQPPTVGSSATGYYVKRQVEELTSGLAKEYVDKRLKAALEGVSTQLPVYYEYVYDEETGTYVPVYEYKLTSDSTAQEGKTYYERKGTGSTSDPYYYVVQTLSIGDSVEGLYERVGQKTTTNPTEEEKKYPVIDSETGEQVTESTTKVDSTTTETIIKTIEENATISDREIIDLFA